MINLIGAYVVTVMLLAIVQQRPSFAKGEENLEELPVFVHIPLLLFLAALAVQQATSLLSLYSFIALPNEVFWGANFWVHEAGHIYFIWGGRFLHSLGGTLNEIIFPLVPATYCFIKGYQKLSALFLYWFGHSCFGIAIYMADARAMVLPLSTGDSAGHDWHNILEMLNLLPYDTTMAAGVTFLGWAILAIAFALYGSSLLGITILRKRSSSSDVAPRQNPQAPS